MKNARPSADGGRALKTEFRSHGAQASPLSFTIVELEAVAYGMKRAIGKIEIAGFGVVDVEYFRPANRPAFAETLSIRNRYTGRYERIASLDPDFAHELLTAIESRLNADAESPGPD